MSTQCWLPYYHAEIRTDGSVRPCCRYQLPWINSLVEYNSKDRSEFEQAQLPVACSPCIGIEHSYREVKIHDFRKMWEEPVAPSLRSLILSLDNTCSNSCIMCNEYSSTTIGHLKNINMKRTWDFNNINFDELEIIVITGGEPLQSNKMPELCDKLINSRLKEINLITSLAKVREKNLLALEAVGKPLAFRVSIDGPWDLCTWVRGVEQNDWLKNLERIRVHKINWQISLGAYNVFALPETLNYIETLVPGAHIQSSIADGPWPAFRIASMPQDLKAKIKNKIQKHSVRSNEENIVQTALELLNKHEDANWDESLKKMEEIALLRGETRRLTSFIEQYLGQ